MFCNYINFGLEDKDNYCVSNNMLIKCDEKTLDNYLYILI